MNVLVTGGAGFIGSHLVDALMVEGHEVVVLDDLSVGKLENVAHHLFSDRFRFVRDSVLNEAVLEPLVRWADVVFHLAAVVGVKYVVEDPLRAIRVNIRGTENVLDLAFRYGVRTVVASSSEVYGKSTHVPLREDNDRLLGPTTVPRWSYADAKAIDEYIALAYARQGLPVTIVRYFNAYGPRLDPRGYGSVVARFFTQALRGEPLTIYGDGQQTRSFTYVSDTVRGTILAGTKPEAAGQIFNIGSDREITINDLAQRILELTGSRSEIVHVPYSEAYGPDFEETRRRVPDVSRAREVLGFEARIPLEEGLRRTLEWFRRTVLASLEVADECRNDGVGAFFAPPALSGRV
ncbi:MAG: NAD-dependent epimerase/dehydratase family protein [Anaerolineae bacterium]|nr:NAD-dependent epimerase/dehydratase family protein [Anaerolineae bacterium]MCX8066501.1 NAD-dependent epimerase/dehydratase family protein [Anaerolineae bacterium]MDW7991123.1 NAD-dependent epimerase/dehydratase family protein [Anaerolineae bacterium]